MSAALEYREPYRVYAGLLAVAVHLLFLVVLYFGVRWQSRPPEEFAVEMWQTLPNAEVVPEQPPAPPVPPEPAPAPVPKAAAPALPPMKAEIEMREKKKKRAEQKAQEAKKEAAARARQEKERRELEEYAARNLQAERARVRAEVEAATRVQVQRYEDKIRNKIRRHMKQVADVPDSAEAIFKVTLLPDGSLMGNPVLIKGSGVAAYDEAAERAILAAEPLPVPTDQPALLPMFRELKLSIRP